MPIKARSALFASLAIASLAYASSPAFARPGGWYGGSGGQWGAGGFDGPGFRYSRPERDRSREGRIEVSRFVADGKAGLLGHGSIAVTSGSSDDAFTGASERAPFEAAVVDRLVQAGYDTQSTNVSAGQIAELRVIRSEIQPAEPRRSPVSGEADMSVSNRGTAYGLAVAVDLTKPLPPLVSTRLEARIRDKATGEVLWEAHADVAAREGDARWTTQETARKLAEALFDHFPRPA